MCPIVDQNGQLLDAHGGLPQSSLECGTVVTYCKSLPQSDLEVGSLLTPCAAKIRQCNLHVTTSGLSLVPFICAKCVQFARERQMNFGLFRLWHDIAPADNMVQ